MIYIFADHPSAATHIQESATGEWPLIFGISLLASIAILSGALFFMKLSSERLHSSSKEVKPKN